MRGEKKVSLNVLMFGDLSSLHLGTSSWCFLRYWVEHVFLLVFFLILKYAA